MVWRDATLTPGFDVTLPPVDHGSWDRGPNPFSTSDPSPGTPRRFWGEKDGLGPSVSSHIGTEAPGFDVRPHATLAPVALIGWDRGPRPFSASDLPPGTSSRVWEKKDGLGPSVLDHIGPVPHLLFIMKR